MTKNPFILGILLFGATMLIFFVVYFFFSGINYFETSMIINAFALPVLYAGTAFWSVKTAWNKKRLNFKEAFQKSFVPMFVGGLLSVISIFTFLNFVDRDAKDLLNYQFVQTNKQKLEDTYQAEKSRLKTEKEILDLEVDYQKNLQSFNSEQVKGKDMLTFSHFSGYFAAILIFYLVLSLFFGAFLRSRSSANQ
ncbi:DUF4199 domain-containing protein [Chryseobacterium sp.]|uniref:DUF4199 domain-containing protein n=1 Tax=Chryseobacterium sp. TaxID=1871047 RepID=UPI00388D5ABE